ncbi:MAG: sigma-54 dependent transcriptional regulator [Desulfobacterales bacterium]|nr:sigma-54 dependent transcriptional regulator [Desulfobacterales bacterium]
MLAKILVVDDEQNMLKLFQKILGKEAFTISTAESGTEALGLLDQENFDLIISDILMPKMSGMELMKEVKTHHPDIPFIVITAHGSIGSAVEAMKAGAFDYLTKPFRKDDILLVINKTLKYSRLHDEVRRLRMELKERDCFKEIIGNSKAMDGVLKLISKIADSQATVLIQGESGTGKELIARAIHDLSSRRDESFMGVDCSVLPEHLLQSELFGHVKGAFTGAVKEKKGLFFAAHGGTLFLDEIGNISPAVQLNLLRVLQEKEIKPVGSVTNIKVDVRVIVASNVDLQQAISNGTFRKDLYYRLAVVPVNLPPLRERAEDIAPLAHHFMRKYVKTYQKNISDITPGAMHALMANPWPGNVRELENFMERAVLLNSGRSIDETSLFFPATDGDTTQPGNGLNLLKSATRDLIRTKEKRAIATALREADGKKNRAAKLLGISRSTLYSKMKALGIEN